LGVSLVKSDFVIVDVKVNVAVDLILTEQHAKEL